MKSALSAAGLCALLLLAACNQSPEALIQSGNRYHDRKKFREASILYQKAIAKDKTNGEAYYREGLNQLDQANLGEATKFLRRAIDLKPSNTDAETKLAEIYLGAYATNPQRFKNLLGDVEDLNRKILASRPDSFDGYRIAGMLNLARNNREQALVSFDKANRIQPHSTELVGWYAETLAASQRSVEAEKLVRETLDAHPRWGQGYDFLFLLNSRAGDKAKSESVLKERLDHDPSNAVAVQNYANYLLLQNRFEEGEAVMKRVLNNKEFPAGHQMLGDYYLRSKKWDQALAEYQAGAKSDSKNAVIYQQRMITAYEAMGKKDDAFQLAKRLAHDNPKNELANESYAALLLASGPRSDLKTASTELKRMTGDITEDGALHLQLARSYYFQAQPDKALPEAIEAVTDETKRKPVRPPILTASRLLAARLYEDRGDHAKTIDETERVLTADPRNADARYLHSRALAGINQTARAQSDLEALLTEVPQYTDARLALAAIYLSQHQLEKAAAEFDKASKANPGDNRGLLGLQAVKLEQGKGEEAIAVVQGLVEKNPNVPAYRQELANFQASTGEQVFRTDPDHAAKLFAAAADNYKELLKLKPGVAENWVRLGALQRQLNRTDQALSSFEEASKADPRNINALMNRAMLLDSIGKGSEAADIYSKVLGLDPENPLALNNVAFMDAEKGVNLDQAMTFAERAKKRVPNSSDISDTLGYVYLQKNLNSEALRIFQQVVKENPANPTYRFHLAMALLKQGDRQGAKEEAQKALSASRQQDQQNKIRTFVSQLG